MNDYCKLLAHSLRVNDHPKSYIVEYGRSLPKFLPQILYHRKYHVHVSIATFTEESISYKSIGTACTFNCSTFCCIRDFTKTIFTAVSSIGDTFRVALYLKRINCNNYVTITKINFVQSNSIIIILLYIQ